MPRDVLWQPAKPLESVLNSSADDYEPRLSSDGLTLFFVRGKAGQNADLYTSRRSFGGWEEPQPVAGANSQFDDLGPAPSIDGQTLYFYSNREGGLGGYDLWMSRRGQDGWQPATNLGPIVNSEFNDYGPAVSPSGSMLHFASNRPQPGDARPPNPDAWSATLREDLFSRTYDLYASAITDAGFGRAEPMAALNTPFNEGAPAVSPFGDFVYFASDRPGGHGGFDLYRSRRLRGEYNPPKNLGDAVNTLANELDPALSMGGYELSFSSDRSTAGGATAASRDYNLYHTTSREVFTEVEELACPPINWAALWRLVGPNVLWALFALLLVVFMLALFRGMRDKRLSLMMKCLLASIVAHLLLMLLFNTWEVAAGLGEFTAGRRGPIQVALGSTGTGNSITAQIRGSLTEVQVPAMPMMTAHRAASQVDPSFAFVAVQPNVPRAAVNLTTQVAVSVPAVDSSPQWRPGRVVLATGAMSSAPLTVNPRLPDSPPPDGAAEVKAAGIGRPAERSPHARAALVLGSSAAPAMVETMTTLHDPSLGFQSLQSLASSSEPRDTLPPATTMPPSPSSELSVATHVIPLAADQPMLLLLPAEAPAGPKQAESTAARTIATPLPAGLPRASASSPISSTSLSTIAIAPAANRPYIGTSPTLYGGGGSVTDAGAPSQGWAQSLAIGTHSALEPRPVAFPLATMGEGGAPAAITESSSLAVNVALPTSVRAASLPAGGQPQLRRADQPTASTGRAALGSSGVSIAGTTKSADAASFPRARSLEPLVSTQRIASSPATGLNLSTPIDELPPASPYVQRFADDRLEIVERMGGSKETENAVERALKWLAAHQSADGRWDGQDFDRDCGQCGGETLVKADNALTGLGLLCFLGAGHTHTKDGPYRQNVERGLKWLASQQKAGGDLRGDETLYSHGIATIALSEAFAMTGDSSLREPVQQAVSFIERARNRNIGGWRYDPGQAGDTSVLGWQVMALKSASMAGLEVAQSSFDAAAAWLQRVSDRRNLGRYSYQPGREATPSMTGEAMFVQQLLGTPPTSARMQGSVKFVIQHLPQWDSANTYYWYYATLSLFQHQGEAWQHWNAALQEQLLANQRTDGRAAGSWDPVGEWADVGGRVYQTALCTLMLEVYYRYLPLYWLPVPSADDAVTGLQSDAIGTIRGVVTSAESGESLPGATVRLTVPDRESIEVLTGPDGSYILSVPPVPEFFALSASHEGFAPRSANVERERLEGRTIEVNFALEPTSSAILVMEAVPDVHHLGDNHFSGAINSQFQKRSEGATFAVQFDLSEDQLPPRFNRAEVRLLAKGVQRDHRIVINGETLKKRLNKAPDDGGFGEFSAPFAPSLLRGGSNTLEIIAAPSVDDIDDFEFVNVQVRLGP